MFCVSRNFRRGGSAGCWPRDSRSSTAPLTHLLNYTYFYSLIYSYSAYPPHHDMSSDLLKSHLSLVKDRLPVKVSKSQSTKQKSKKLTSVIGKSYLGEWVSEWVSECVCVSIFLKIYHYTVVVVCMYYSLCGSIFFVTFFIFLFFQNTLAKTSLTSNRELPPISTYWPRNQKRNQSRKRRESLSLMWINKGLSMLSCTVGTIVDICWLVYQRIFYCWWNDLL